MNWMHALGPLGRNTVSPRATGLAALVAAIAVGSPAGCAGYENVDVEVDDEAPPVAIVEVASAVDAASEVDVAREVDVAPEADVAAETDPEQYWISVEIPVDDVTIERGENLDVDAMLTERTAFKAGDFHLREVVIIARSRRGGSAELIVDEWASGAVDVPEGTADSWFEVRIPAADVGEAGVDWVVDFTGALDLNLLVAVLEPRTELLAAATATVREVVVEDQVPADQAGEAVEVVQSVEVVEEPASTQTVVKDVAVVEQPVYRTKTVYRYVDRPVYSYRVSWIYDPARYYVFSNYGGWSYRYFPGTWDWRFYDLSFRLPSRHHHHDRHRHRADRHDGRRYERRDRDDHRGDRDGRRRDRDRDFRDRRDGDDRDRDRPGVRQRGSEGRAVVSRPRATLRRVDPGNPRVRLATQRREEPRVEEGRRTNPRLRAQRNDPPSSRARVTDRTAQGVARATNPRTNPFQRRNPGATTRPGAEADIGRQGAATNPTPTVRNARTHTFQRRPEQQTTARAATPPVRTLSPRGRTASPPTRTASPRTTNPRVRTPTPTVDAQDRENTRRYNARTRTFQREADRPTVVRSTPRAVEPRRTAVSRRSTTSNVDRRRTADAERADAGTRSGPRAVTRTFQRSSEPRVVERPRPRTETPSPQSRPRYTARPTPPRQIPSSASRPQRAAPSRQTPRATPQRAAPSRQTSRPTPQRAVPTRQTSRPAPQPNRPAQRPPAKPQSDSGSDARSDEGRRSNGRTRAFERR